jgi:hypothetical protein
MPKLLLEIAHDVNRKRRGARTLGIAALLLLGGLTVPVLLECGSLCLSQWHEVSGRSYVVRTPILDAMGMKLEHARQDIWEFVEPHVLSMNWNAAFVFPILAALMILAMMLLRQ